MSKEWFDIKDYPYFTRVREFVAAKAKNDPDVMKELDDKGPVLSCVLLLVAHSGGKGKADDLKAGLVDFVKLVREAPDDVLFDIGESILELTAGEDSMLHQMVGIEEAKRKGKVKTWSVTFDGRQVRFGYEPA